MDTPLLDIQHLKVTYRDGGLFQGGRHTVAVDDVSLEVPFEPSLLTLVGESGSGKSTLARAILGLKAYDTGHIRFQGQDMARFGQRQWFDFRRQVQPIFQDPYASYNPFYRIDRVFKTLVRKFKLASNSLDTEKLIEDSLRAVDLRPPDVLGRYPHQLSGGERQRVMLARVYMMRPRLIIADEPISMIDAALRALFLNILLDFQEQGISCLFITHNLATAYYLGGDIMVMCRGRVIERGPMDDVVTQPAHPYTQLLIDSVPSHDPHKRWDTAHDATTVLDSSEFEFSEHACVFQARCPHVMDRCRTERPAFFPAHAKSGQDSACFLYAEDQADAQGPRGAFP